MSQIWRSFRIGAAIVLLLGGAVLAPTPIPVGWILILIGLSILVHESKWFRNRLRNMRARYPGFGRKLNQAKRYAPGFARRVIDKTDPLRRRRRVKVPIAVKDVQPPPAE